MNDTQNKHAKMIKQHVSQICIFLFLEIISMKEKRQKKNYSENT